MPDLAALLAHALGRAPGPTEPLAIAVSGGPDSLALLWLAAVAYPGRITALTVDHGLRAASAAEAAGVAKLCAAAAIPYVTLPWLGPKPATNIQAAARTARYELMAEWCAAHDVPLLLTAHHADDAAETLLMRMARGSGSAGLAGIRLCRNLSATVTLVRPLLAIRRSALAAIVARSGWTAIDDLANRDPRYGRSHARALLAGTPWLDPARLAAAAAHLADAEAALAWTADRAWAGNVATTAAGIGIDPAGLPVEIVRRLVARAIAAINPDSSPGGPEIARLTARLVAGDSATLASVKARGGPLWRFSPAPPRRKSP